MLKYSLGFVIPPSSHFIIAQTEPSLTLGCRYSLAKSSQASSLIEASGWARRSEVPEAACAFGSGSSLGGAAWMDVPRV